MDSIIVKNLEHPAFHKYNGQSAQILKVYGEAPFAICLHVKFDDGRELHIRQKDQNFDYRDKWSSVSPKYGPTPTALRRILRNSARSAC